jgi:hypothetical protein
MSVAEEVMKVPRSVATQLAAVDPGNPVAVANHEAAAAEQRRLFLVQIRAFLEWAWAARDAHGYASAGLLVAKDAVFKAAKLVDGNVR